MIGESLTIFQGPDCWPKEFTIRKPFDPAVERMILAAIQREMRGTSAAALSRKVKATPGLGKRIRTARTVRRPG